MCTVQYPWKLAYQAYTPHLGELKLGKVKEACAFIQFKLVSYTSNGKNMARKMIEMMDQIESLNL